MLLVYYLFCLSNLEYFELCNMQDDYLDNERIGIKEKKILFGKLKIHVIPIFYFSLKSVKSRI